MPFADFEIRSFSVKNVHPFTIPVLSLALKSVLVCVCLLHSYVCICIGRCVQFMSQYVQLVKCVMLSHVYYVCVAVCVCVCVCVGLRSTPPSGGPGISSGQYMSVG